MEIPLDFCSALLSDLCGFSQTAAATLESPETKFPLLSFLSLELARPEEKGGRLSLLFCFFTSLFFSFLGWPSLAPAVFSSLPYAALKIRDTTTGRL